MIRLLLNPGLERQRDYGEAERAVLNLERLEEAASEIASWPGYRPTPLRDLPGLARELQIEAVRYKDEASRFGLGSFKALGGAYGILMALRRCLGRPRLRAADLEDAGLRRLVGQVTVTCATDGNHGRAVAWGARRFGCRCVVFLPAAVSPAREAAIRALGADVVRTGGDYDAAVRQADEEARDRDWVVISDQSYAGYEVVPRDIMQGYTVMVREALDELGPAPPTHVFVQGGVGGLAAAVLSVLWERQGRTRPRLVVVEPERADCLYRSADAGEPVTVPGPHETFMACLACGEPSSLAWRLLGPGADAFLAIADAWAEDAMRWLADPERSGAAEVIVAGEAGAAGAAGARAVASDAGARRQLGLDGASRLLLFGTEGATDPEIYRRVVGEPGGAARPEGARDGLLVRPRR